MLTNNAIILFSWVPLIAFLLFCCLRMFGYFKW